MIVSVGYEGREIGEFVAALAEAGVDVVADVRLRASSRRPGFAKTALTAALASAGIGYRHLRGLGNPAANRAAFHGGDVTHGRAVFAAALAGPDARADLDTLRRFDRAGVVAVLCVEADEAHCHRAVVIEALAGPPRQ